MINRRSTTIHRGDIYLADLAPVVGSEQGGIRPVLIIQNDIGNQHSPTVIAAVITGQIKHRYLPTHVLLEAPGCGLLKKSMVMLEHRPRYGRYTAPSGRRPPPEPPGP